MNKINNNRRKFLTKIGATALLLAAKPKELFAIGNDSTNSSIPSNVTIDSNIPPLQNNIIFPKSLIEGSKVAITAPSSPSSPWDVSVPVKTFKKWGCEVELGNTIKYHNTKNRYLSAPDSERAEEFMNFINDKNIDCIMCARGGYGSMRILPYLDFDAIKANPKIIIGYSDITALLTAIHTKTGLVCYHGPVASSAFNDFSARFLKQMIFEVEQYEPITIGYSDLEVVYGGTATGKLCGGNLSMIVSTLGTPYEIDTKDSILFLEDTTEEPYKIDRMMTQLWLAKKFDECNGVVFGDFANLDRRRNFYPRYSFTVREIITSRMNELQKPSILGLPFGHVRNKLTLPIGVKAELIADEKQLTIIEPAVSQNNKV